MKILHIGKYYPPFHGGMEHYLQDLAEEQVKQGHQVTVLVHNHNCGALLSKTTTEEIHGVQVIRLKSTRPIFFTPLMWRLGKALNQLISQQKTDLIHLHWPNPSLAFLLLNKKAKSIPWVMRWHSDMVTEASSLILKIIYRLVRPIEQTLIKQCQNVICSSPAYIEHSPALAKHKSKCEVIPLGIKPMFNDTKSLPVAWAEKLWPKNKLRVFHLGRLTFYKNQKLLVNAASQSKHHHTILAGEGQLKERLQQQINDKKVAEQVSLTGSLDWQQINALYQTCDVFCLPSHDRAESFGVVLLEAMWHNKIILVADTAGSGMAWLAEQYNKGFVFKSDDATDLIKQLQYIKNNLPSIQALPKDFKWPIEKTAKQLNQLYQNSQVPITKEETP